MSNIYVKFYSNKLTFFLKNTLKQTPFQLTYRPSTLTYRPSTLSYRPSTLHIYCRPKKCTTFAHKYEYCAQ